MINIGIHTYRIATEVALYVVFGITVMTVIISNLCIYFFIPKTILKHINWRFWPFIWRKARRGVMATRQVCSLDLNISALEKLQGIPAWKKIFQISVKVTLLDTAMETRQDCVWPWPWQGVFDNSSKAVKVVWL